jgi:hypothetical protein
MAAESPDESYDLVMPFVTVASKGGPHDDTAYVAGYEMGLLDAVLEHTSDLIVERTIHASNAPQADLLAMKHGYRCDLLPHDDQWTFATFTWREARRG